MKVLFLDIDGVLNNDTTKEKVQTVFGSFTGINSILLNRFLNWRQFRDIEVVLSSSWRLDERYNYAFTKHLNDLGITWIDVTSRIGTRGAEIKDWLDRHTDVTHYAILDDIAVDMKPVSEHLVQTSYVKGLRNKDLKKIDILLDIKKGNIMNDNVSNQMADAQVELANPAEVKEQETIKTVTFQTPEITGQEVTEDTTSPVVI